MFLAVSIDGLISLSSYLPKVRGKINHYDLNGNATTDGLRGMQVGYNLLNLPKSVSKGTETISYIYSAQGEKLAKMMTNGTYQYYAGSMVYKNDRSLNYLLMDEGMVNKVSGGYAYEYHLKDHLGNTRVAFQPNGSATTVTQATEYYPFGMNYMPHSPAGSNKYLYNGKEKQDDVLSTTALDWYDYGARFYDPGIGRWHVVDNKAEKYAGSTPYAYALNNPILFLDPDGNDVKVSIVDNKDGSRTVTFNVVMGIRNTGRNPSNDLKAYEKAAVDQIQKSFSSYDSKNKTTYKTMVTIDANEKDYVMDFTDAVREKEGNVTKKYSGKGGTNTKNGEFKKNTMQVNVMAVDGIEGVARTAAHEFGHTLSLEHPAGDPEEGDNPVETVKSSTDNLMRQSRHTSGTKITNRQLKKAEEHVDENQ